MSSAITDWLMVAITAVYVIATIFICVFNGKSARATQKQIIVTQQQHEENKRLSYRPYFYIQLKETQSGSTHPILLDLGDDETESYRRNNFYIHFMNIGNGAAKKIECVCENGLECFGIERFPFHIALPNVENKAILQVCFPIISGNSSSRYHPCLHFTFSDLLENKYEQTLLLVFDYFLDSISLTYQWVSEPQLIKNEIK